MKTMKYLAAVALINLGLTVTASATDPILSPKAADFRSQSKKVAINLNEPNLVANRPAGNVKAWELTQRNVGKPTTGIDLAHAPRPMYSPRDPRFETALRANAIKQFEIAPLK